MENRAIQQAPPPSLRQWLAARSTGELRTLARLWRLELGDQPDAEALLSAMTEPAAAGSLLARLRPEDRAALERLLAEGGALPVQILEREFGTIREHRAYANPRAYLDALAAPPSPTERLYVLGLIQRRQASFGAEYAVPQELLPLLPAVPPRDRQMRLAALTPPAHSWGGDPALFERWLVGLLSAAYQSPLPVSQDGALRSIKSRLVDLPGLDDAATSVSERSQPALGLLRHLAVNLGLLRRTVAGLKPAPAALSWLERPALERRRSMLEGWIDCRWDELTALCGLRWRTPPLRRDQAAARRALLRLLAQAEPGHWFSLDAWVAEVRRVDPDYQRPDGLYDSWMLSDEQGASVVGFTFWREVEGRMARAVVTGPLAWLGLCELGAAAEDGEPVMARVSPWGAALLADSAAPKVQEEPLVVQPNFTIFAPPGLPPLPRFQLSRIAERESYGSFDRYTLTRETFMRALDRGIDVEEVLSFLERWGAEPVPQNVAFALRDWTAARRELRLRPALLLEADDPLRLQQLRRDRRVALPPAEELDARRWALAEADGAALVEALRRAGYGVEAELPAAADQLEERDLSALLCYAEVVALLAERLGAMGAPSAALRQRLSRRLPSRAAAQARREAAALADSLARSLEKEKNQ